MNEQHLIIIMRNELKRNITKYLSQVKYILLEINIKLFILNFPVKRPTFEIVVSWKKNLRVDMSFLFDFRNRPFIQNMYPSTLSAGWRRLCVSWEVSAGG